MSADAAMISVILPVYNRENYIEYAIDSILRQTFTSWELIIIDDGSTDHTGAICDAYMSRDSRIRVIHTENLGVSHARNVGLDNARGEWIAFLDSDDEYAENALETMSSATSGVELVIGESFWLPECENWGSCVLYEVVFDSTSSLSETAYQHGLYNHVWGKLFRRSAISGLYFDESIQYGEDSIFCLHAIQRNLQIKYIQCFLHYYHKETDNSLTKCFHLSKLSSARKLYELKNECFSSNGMVRNAARAYCIFAVVFFRTLICSDRIDSSSKYIAVQMQLDDNIVDIDFIDGNTDLMTYYSEAWNILKTGNAEKVISWYQKNEEESMKVFETKKYNDSQIPKSSFLIQLAGIIVEIRNRYELIVEKCEKYIVPGHEHPHISVCAPLSRMDYSRKYKFEFDGEIIHDDYAEYDVLPYQFYGDLPKFNAFWLHSVVIEKDGVGYAFSAQPGIGKSTHAALWLKAFPDAHIINGDNPIIRLNPEDGKFYAYGTPFCGKEGYNENRGVPLKAVCFLERGEENEIHRMRPEFVLTRLMRDNFCINSENGEAHYYLYKKFIEMTKFYSLKCNMDVEAAEVAYAGLSSPN